MYTEKSLLVHKEKELSKDIHIQLIICLDCNHYLHSTEVKQMANTYGLFTLFPNANCIFQIKIIENCTIWLVRTYWHITHTHTHTIRFYKCFPFPNASNWHLRRRRHRLEYTLKANRFHFILGNNWLVTPVTYTDTHTHTKLFPFMLDVQSETVRERERWGLKSVKMR